MSDTKKGIAIKKIQKHLKSTKHETPVHLQDTYSGIGCPMGFCRQCVKIAEEAGIKSWGEIEGLRCGMYECWFEEEKSGGGRSA